MITGVSLIHPSRMMMTILHILKGFMDAQWFREQSVSGLHQKQSTQPRQEVLG